MINMDEKELKEFLAAIDETMFLPWLKQITETAATHYDKLVKSGKYPQDAMFDIVTKTAYQTMKHSVTIALAFMLLKPDRPLTKDELRSMLTVIISPIDQE
jgi:hypothetical protein